MVLRSAGFHCLCVYRSQALINFDSQKDLSQCQLQWQEYMSQYELVMRYITGEQNTVADELLQLPPDTFSEDLPPHVICSSGVNTTMPILTDPAIL